MSSNELFLCGLRKAQLVVVGSQTRYHCKKCGRDSCGEVVRESLLKRLKGWWRYWKPTSLT